VDAALFWLYLAGLTLIVLHTIDGAYWKEWELLGFPGGIVGFLLFHLPLLAAAFWGLALAREGGPAGQVAALWVAAAGFITFGVHLWFLRKGRPEFDSPASKAIIWACLPAALALAGVALAGLVGGA